MTSQVDPSSPLSRSWERVRVRARGLRQASPDAERVLWQRLRARQLDDWKFRRQHPIGGYFADFACIEAGLVVELDGEQHLDEAALRYDARRTAKLNELGYAVLRFNDREALLETDAVLTRILDWLTAHRPHPNPLPQAGEGANANTSLSRAAEIVQSEKD